MPTIYKVGQPYSPTKRNWPEGVDYNYRAGEHELRLFFRSPNPQEVESVRTGPSQFAFTVLDGIIFFCYRFGPALPWGDCAYSIYLIPENERTVPEMPKTDVERALLTTMLIDAENGIIRAMRVTSFSPRFTRELHQAITNQANIPFPGMEQHLARGLAIQAKYTSAHLATVMAKVRCRGGE